MKGSSRQLKSRKNQNFKGKPGFIYCIIKGVVLSLFLALTSTLILTFLLSYWDLSFVEAHLQWIMVAITVISIFIGSTYSTYRVESKGLIIGILVGLFYILSGVAVTWTLGNDSFSLLLFTNKLVAGIAAGALGGLLGVNL